MVEQATYLEVVGERFEELSVNITEVLPLQHSYPFKGAPNLNQCLSNLGRLSNLHVGIGVREDCIYIYLLISYYPFNGIKSRAIFQGLTKTNIDMLDLGKIN